MRRLRIFTTNLFKFSQKQFLTKSKPSENNPLLNPKNQNIKISFDSKFQISPDNYIFRFNLPEIDAFLGVQPGQYIKLESNIPIPQKNQSEFMSKPYHPITIDSDYGYVDFLIKIYRSNSLNPLNPTNSYGIFSNFLYNLQKGQVINLSGPFGEFSYLNRGNFSLKTDVMKKVKRITLIAGGTGIAPMFQLIRKITSDKKDKTAISLIYATKTLDELAFCNDFIEYDKKGKIYFYPVVENVENIKNWIYGVGRINKEILINNLPSNKDKDSMIMLCGPHQMINDTCLPLLKELEYSEENIFSFS